MIIDELIIDSKDPFKNCKLNRKIQANIFLNLIPGFTKGGVIALNNKWGTGKTSFIKMLDIHLQNNNYTTVYFNAWENDFEDNPLSALISELKDKFPNEATVKTVIRHAAKIALDVSSNISKHLIEKYIGEKSIKLIAESLNNSAEKIFEEEIEEYSKKKKSLNDFRKALIDFISSNTKNQPLIFFIDELDRCRPNYSVKVLECIKHLFSVPNLLFVLSIDKEQLGNAINGYYGSEKFNSDEYLRRFIDLEYQLPSIEKKDFIRSTSDGLGLDSLLQRRYSSKYNVFYSIFNELFSNFSLRQIEKILLHMWIVLESKALYLELMYLFQYLIFLKYKHPQFYNDIFLKKLNTKELQDEYTNIYLKDLNTNSEERDQMFASIEAELLFGYSNSFSVYDKLSQNFKILENGDTEPKLNSSINHNWFKDQLRIINKSVIGRFKITELMNIINLMD